jgi:hypothetical protein
MDSGDKLAEGKQDRLGALIVVLILARLRPDPLEAGRRSFSGFGLQFANLDFVAFAKSHGAAGSRWPRRRILPAPKAALDRTQVVFVRSGECGRSDS